MPEKTSNHVRSVDSDHSRPAKRALPAWIRMGAVAAASALAGGLAAAWFYRKTLRALREAEAKPEDPRYYVPHYDTDRDT